MDIDLSDPFYKARRASFLSSLVAPSPLLVCHYWEGGPNGVTVKKFMGWRLKVHGLTVQGLRVDGFKRLGWRFKWLGWQLQKRTLSAIQTSDKLSGSHYGAWHVSFFDWFLSQIETLPCLPCTFPINTKVVSSHFFIFSWNILSERNRHIVITTVDTFPSFAWFIHHWFKKNW